MIWKIISIASGGAIGAIMRYGVSLFTTKNSTSIYPWATFIVNLLGAFFYWFFLGFF